MLLTKKVAAPTRFKIPPLAEPGSDLATLTTRRSELNAKASAIELERQRLWPAAKDGPDDGDVAVGHLLGDEPDSDNPSRQVARTRLAEIAVESESIRKALEVLKQRERVAHGKASRILCEAVRPEYRRRVRAMHDALMAARAAQLEYDQLVTDIDNSGAAWSPLIALSPHRLLGDPRDRYGQLAYFARECAEAGYVETAEIPEGIR